MSDSVCVVSLYIIISVSEFVVSICPQEYKLLFEGAGSNPGDKTLEDRFFEHEVSQFIRYTLYTKLENLINLLKVM